MARYHVDNRFTLTQQSLTTTFKTLSTAYVTSGSLCRGRAVALSVGADGTPNASDCAIVYAIARQTTSAGTANVVVSQLNDQADVASRILSKVNYTAEPTYVSTALVWSRALNQRASMQWNAPDLDAAIRWSATEGVGICLVALSPTYTATALGGIDFEE